MSHVGYVLDACALPDVPALALGRRVPLGIVRAYQLGRPRLEYGLCIYMMPGGARRPRAIVDASGRPRAPRMQPTPPAPPNPPSELSICFSYIVGGTTCDCGFIF